MAHRQEMENPPGFSPRRRLLGELYTKLLGGRLPHTDGTLLLNGHTIKEGPWEKKKISWGDQQKQSN